MAQEKPDCTACEQMLLEAGDLDAARRRESVAEHLAACPSCTDFFHALLDVKPHLDQYRTPAPSGELIDALLARAERRIHAVSAERTIPSSANLFRVVLACIAALPFVLLINTAMGYALYEFAAIVLPRTVALYVIVLFAAWVSLGISLSYASLPFLSLLAREKPHRAWRR